MVVITCADLISCSCCSLSVDMAEGYGEDEDSD